MLLLQIGKCTQLCPVFLSCMITQCMFASIATVGAPMKLNSAQIGATLVRPAETSFDKRKRACVNNLLRLWQRLCVGDDRTGFNRREEAQQQKSKITQSSSGIAKQRPSEKTAIGRHFLYLQSCLGRCDESGKTWIQHLKGLSLRLGV